MYNISHGAMNRNEVSLTFVYTPTLVNIILPTTLMQVPNDYNVNTLTILYIHLIMLMVNNNTKLYNSGDNNYFAYNIMYIYYIVNSYTRYLCV